MGSERSCPHDPSSLLLLPLPFPDFEAGPPSDSDPEESESDSEDDSSDDSPNSFCLLKIQQTILKVVVVCKLVQNCTKRCNNWQSIVAKLCSWCDCCPTGGGSTKEEAEYEAYFWIFSY